MVNISSEQCSCLEYNNIFDNCGSNGKLTISLPVQESPSMQKKTIHRGRKKERQAGATDRERAMSEEKR
jgi:hypothetical protein